VDCRSPQRQSQVLGGSDGAEEGWEGFAGGVRWRPSVVPRLRDFGEFRGYGVKEEFAHVTAVAGRALARQGRKDRGERYDNVPNVVMFWDPWKVGGSLTFRQCAKCRNV